MTYTKPEWYTPAEVAVHNKATDCWISLNGVVRDLTSWLQDQFKLCKCIKNCTCPVKNWYCGPECVEYCNCFKFGYEFCDRKRLAITILAYAGKDISHWFKGEEWVHYTHPITGTTTVYQQHGPGNQQPVVPSTRWRPLTRPWWLDSSNVVGKVTAKTRPIRITNTLTGSSVTLEVCSEETIYQIMMRYLPHNSHMLSYTWRYLGRPLCYEWTLHQNGIPDERDRFEKVALPDNLHIPDLLLYYNDDLTEDPPKENCLCTEKECTFDVPEKCQEDFFL
ncbi:cytochrome b5 domain-containing protein 1 [Danaus plexippus]|uniref:Cytochrome b5 domain-containing protein 1 n=1 Tax=Danaus plexippus plexippus TaxID=278856 RepID=A0A212EVI4_DANPL|nr:cytochrome b5 domain-containing protein 1 [Danaus plexippus]OWR45508.1 cytochrome b5 domain-containing protein 1 [Danaus plexippus plexippus]